jgi:RNA polymerase sigma-70 factor (ECF subfamily)
MFKTTALTERERGPLERAADNHPQFMRLFLENELAVLRSIMVFIPHRPDARDVMQDTALALWKHFSQYDSGRPFANWACGYARIEVRRFLRGAHRRAKLTEQAMNALIITDGEDDSERERQLADCRSRLRPEHRNILDGYYVEEEAVESLAERHGKSVDALYKILQRVRRLLLECMERKMTEAKA